MTSFGARLRVVACSPWSLSTTTATSTATSPFIGSGPRSVLAAGSVEPVGSEVLRLSTAWFGVWPSPGHRRVVPSVNRVTPGWDGRPHPPPLTEHPRIPQQRTREEEQLMSGTTLTAPPATPGTTSAPLVSAEGMTALTTEHCTLQAARAATTHESNGRASLYLASVAGVVGGGRPSGEQQPPDLRWRP